MNDQSVDLDGNPCTPGWDVNCLGTPLSGGATLPTSFTLPSFNFSAAGGGLSSVPWYVWAVLGGGALLLLAGRK